MENCCVAVGVKLETVFIYFLQTTQKKNLLAVNRQFGHGRGGGGGGMGVFSCNHRAFALK